MSRTARVERATNETKLVVELDLDGTGTADVSHRRRVLRPHARPRWPSTAASTSPCRPTATCTSTPTTPSRTSPSRWARPSPQALGDKRGITRYGDATIPMDEVLAQAAVDLSGRPYFVHAEPENMTPMIGPDYPTSLTRHVLESFAFNARITLHVRVLYAGRDAHHIVEGQFKALARALRAAVALDPRVAGVPSTKGAL